MPITFNALLEAEGFDPKEVRLVRHHDTRRGRIHPYVLWRRAPALLEQYQSIQADNVFGTHCYIASFVRSPSGKTLFIGIYKVAETSVATEADIDPATGESCAGQVKYNMTLDDRLNTMRGRLVVDWGKGFLAWVQYADRNAKEVIELGEVQREPFPGFFQFIWRLSELASLPPEWTIQLRAAKGVYILTSNSTREHYVGSASGQGGFYERWRQHEKAGGDAIAFKGLAPSEYQVSVLQVSAGFETDDDIVRAEHVWMEKLQSRSMGLNGNPTSVPKALDAGSSPTSPALAPAASSPACP